MKNSPGDENNKEKLCVGRCDYCFQTIRTESATVPNALKEGVEVIEERITEAILFCKTCTHTQSLEFE